MYYLGIDVGGTTIKAGLVDESGAVSDTRKIPTLITDLDAFISELTRLITEFQNFAPIEAVGLGVPGLRSTRTRKIETSPNIPCLENIGLEQVLEDQVRIPVVTENDANAGAYAESVCGAARGMKHVAYLTLGTGLGCGLVLSGKLFRGVSGYAGEIGHITVDPNGRLCGCGRRGCLETQVSAPGLVKTAQELLEDADIAPDLTAETVYEAAIRGDAVSREAFTITGRYLGVACADLMNLLNLETIVVGGGVMASGDLLLKPAMEEAERRAFPASFRDCPIVQSLLWPNAGMIGAALLARDR